jgi:phage N-6-adenine-methyltransferase
MPRPRKYRSNAARQAAYRRRKRQAKRQAYLLSKSLWSTPAKLFAELDREFHFTLDVCATSENAKCERFFSPDDDGLAQKWKGVCWMNPPYGRQIDKWVKKALASARSGAATVVCLSPATTGTLWFHKYVLGHSVIRFLKGRFKFGDSSNSAPFDNMIVVFHRTTRRLIG